MGQVLQRDFGRRFCDLEGLLDDGLLLALALDHVDDFGRVVGVEVGKESVLVVLEACKLDLCRFWGATTENLSDRSHFVLESLDFCSLSSKSSAQGVDISITSLKLVVLVVNHRSQGDVIALGVYEVEFGVLEAGALALAQFAVRGSVLLAKVLNRVVNAGSWSQSSALCAKLPKAFGDFIACLC